MVVWCFDKGFCCYFGLVDVVVCNLRFIDSKFFDFFKWENFKVWRFGFVFGNVKYKCRYCVEWDVNVGCGYVVSKRGLNGVVNGGFGWFIYILKYVFFFFVVVEFFNYRFCEYFFNGEKKL